MNSIIIDRFNLIEEWLLESPIIVSFEIVRRDISHIDGKFRIKVTFSDESKAELFEYVMISDSQVDLLKYSFHWQDERGNLRYRWDNAPHHPELYGAPHHRHNADHSVIGISSVLDIFAVLKEIEKRIGYNGLPVSCL